MQCSGRHKPHLSNPEAILPSPSVGQAPGHLPSNLGQCPFEARGPFPASRAFRAQSFGFVGAEAECTHRSLDDIRQSPGFRQTNSKPRTRGQRKQEKTLKILPLRFCNPGTKVVLPRAGILTSNRGQAAIAAAMRSSATESIRLISFRVLHHSRGCPGWKSQTSQTASIRRF